ncbi:YadA-like family protein [Gallibacterium anatis]|uniref:YadA-like family protein n=1 Tax=Gallibacterium anatis TaxID=750 RepID=UPI00057E7791|nr:YadA-like family protein [Gallibacterium anatis]
MKKTTLALILSSILANVAVAETAPTYVDITINNIKEDTGIELGTNSRARGDGSIATGKNSVAIGKNAVATGGNETKDTINQKLNENKQRLQEIQTAQDNTERLLKELQNIRKVEADVIEAGERVKQVRLAKQSAYNVWQDKLKTYNDTVAGSAQFLKDAQAKIDDLNSRLTGVSRIGNVDISSDAGLTNAATQLKSIAEEGTTLNLSVDFYKDYVSSYYQALGDLRQNNIFYNTLSSSDFTRQTSAGVQNLVNAYQYLASIKSLRYSTYYNGSALSFALNVNNPYFNKNTFTGIVGTTQPSADLFLRNFDTEIITLEEWESAKSLATVFKSNFKIFFDNTNDPYMTAEVKSAALNALNKKIDIYLKSNEVTYYQGQYESTRNTVWLDKKQQAIKEYNQLVAEFGALPDPSEVKRKVIENWKAENIDAIRQRNNITTATLTSELEKALGINKNAIAQKEAEIARLKTAADQAKNTYDNTNPSAADIALSQRYEEIMAQLTAKANELKSEQDRLQALRDALTLHDLTNVGENAYAIGTNALATGTNSLAIGTDTIVTGENSIAIGKDSAVTGTNSIAIGTGHIVIGNNAGTFGDPNTIYGDNSYAIGNNNTIGSSATPHTVGTNTFVLGNNVTTTANNAVILGNNSTGADNTVSVGRTDNLRRIINVANGQVAQNSHDAVTGDQLWAVNNQITDINNRLSNANGNDLLAVHYDKHTPTVTLQKTAEKPYVILKVMDGAPDRFITQRVYLDEEGHFIQDPVISQAPAEYVKDTDFRTTFRDLDPNATYTPGQEIITKAYFVKSTEWLPGLPGEGEDPPEYTPDTSDKITGFELYDDPGKTEDISHPVLTVTDTTPVTIKNLADGAIKEGSKEAINGGQLYTALAGKADKDASNITGADKTKWQEALGDGKAEAGNKGLVNGDTLNTELNKKADKTDITNINADLANKANKDASNITGTDKTKWQEALGDGKAETGNKGLVNGDTLNTELNKKANTDLSNITKEGQTVIQNLAKGSVKVVAGTNTTVTKGTDGDATTYSVNVSSEAIKGAVQSDLDGKANSNASNLTETDKTAWKEILGDGEAEAGNKGLINGDTFNTELNKKADKSDITNINTDLAKKANIDASNINVAKFAEKLGTGIVEAGNASLVTGGTVATALENKADSNLSNITNTAKTVIKNLAKDSVKVVKGTNTTVTTSTDGETTTYAVNVSEQSIKNVMQSDMNTKANTDASNIDITKFAEKLGTGTVSKNDTNLVSGKTVYLALQNAVLNGVDVANKANKDASNLSEEDKIAWQESLGNGKAEAGNKGLVTGDTLNSVLDAKVTQVNKTLDSKSNTDASNIDVAKYTIKLTTGRIELGNKGLVNGGQVHNYVQSQVAEMGGRTLAEANSYTDYRIGSLKAYTDKRLKDIRDEARAGVASAMAMSAIPAVPNKRFSIGAGTATYHGQNAVAVGLKVKTENDKAIISLTGSASSNGDFGAAAGFAFGF